MCAINGIANFSAPPAAGADTVKRMNDALSHRGPDGEGIFVSESRAAILGSRRLSIVDVQGGAMPILVRQDGNEYAIVSNGEFFNYKELRRNLEKKYVFTTASDTEVALYAYIEWGEKCVERLSGQFAFLIYDGKKSGIFFARDRVGIKPLYYMTSGGTLIVSSEPKGILACPGVSREPDRESIAEYFLSIMTSMGKSEPLDGSFFTGIRAIRPGERAWFDRDGLRTETYYDVRISRGDSTADTYAALLRKNIARAVLEQVPDEVPYGIPLSGGLDSSILLHTALKSGHRPVTAATVRYAAQDNSDYTFARLMAEREQVALTAPELDGKSTLQNIDAFVRFLDRPSDSTRNIGLFELYRNLRHSGAKVALIGEGADEFNLGYYYTLPGFANGGKECATAEGFRSLLESRVNTVTRYFNPAFVDRRLVEDVIERHVREYYTESGITDPLERMQYFYIKKFLKSRLDMHDRCSMAHSLEARVPFCDERVIAASLSVPPAFNLEHGTEKAVLRAAFINDLPGEIVTRRKSPLPESTSVASHRALLTVFDQALDEADDAVWLLLDRTFAGELRATAERQITALERGEPVALGDGALLTQPVDFRIRHLFLLLTFLRWYQLYFV